jgi:hypothetical protein
VVWLNVTVASESNVDHASVEKERRSLVLLEEPKMLVARPATPYRFPEQLPATPLDRQAFRPPL